MSDGERITLHEREEPKRNADDEARARIERAVAAAGVDACPGYVAARMAMLKRPAGVCQG